MLCIKRCCVLFNLVNLVNLMNDLMNSVDLINLTQVAPEPLEKENNELLCSKREDRVSNPFFELVSKTCQSSFFVPTSAW